MMTYKDVEALADACGLVIAHYGNHTTTAEDLAADRRRAWAVFTNEHNPRRRREKVIEIDYYFNRTEPGRDSWTAGAVYSLDFEGMPRTVAARLERMREAL